MRKFLFSKLLPCKVVEELTISEKLMRVADAIDKLNEAVTDLQDAVLDLDERLVKLEIANQ